MTKPHPSAVMKANAWKLIRAMLGNFGMPPASRTKVGAKGAAEVDPLDEFLKKRK